MCKPQTTRTQLFNMFGGRCAYCGHQLNMKSMTKDHLLAKADGGDNTIENLLPACRECNQGKGHSSLEGWRVDFFLPTLSEDEKSTREKMFAAIAAKKFYFERVAEDQIKKSMQQKNTAKHSKSHKKEEDKDFTLLTDERLEKMESDSGLKDNKVQNEPVKAYNYEATSIEVLKEDIKENRVQSGLMTGRNLSPHLMGSISVAKLLKDVEKSHLPGKKLLDNSQILTSDGHPVTTQHPSSF